MGENKKQIRKEKRKNIRRRIYKSNKRKARRVAKRTRRVAYSLFGGYSIIIFLLVALIVSFVVISAVTTSAGAFLMMFRPGSLKSSDFLGIQEIETGNTHEGGNINDPGNLPSMDKGDMFYIPAEKVAFTSMYGRRNINVSGSSKYHRAVDIGIGRGSNEEVPLYPGRPGKVIEIVRYDNPPAKVQTKVGGGLGQRVILEHQIKGETWKTVYAHMYRVHVNEGDIVGMNTSLGIIGNTGTSGGAHVHFEIHNPAGVKVDPAQLIYCGGKKVVKGMNASVCFKYRSE